MFFAGNRSHVIPLFDSTNVLPLNMPFFDTVDLLILRLRISVIFLLLQIHPTFTQITLDFLMLNIYTFINQD